MTARAAALLLVLLATLPAAADDGVRAQLVRGAQAKLVAVVDGDTVVIDPAPDDAPQVRLVGIQAPKLPLGRKGFKAWPLADTAKTALEDLVLDRPVTLYFGGERMDRHGRHLAHLFRDDGTWVQGHMLANGMARFYSFPENRAVVPAMLDRERRARDARRGIWGLPFYAVRATEPPDDLTKRLGTFQLIEGRVVDAARVKGTVYLNFGSDWRTDFTVILDHRAWRRFDDAGADLLALEGRTVRARGWLRKRNGPTLPEQIEVLDGR